MRCFFLFVFLAVSLLCLSPPIQAVGFRGFTYDGLKEPEIDKSLLTSIDEKWIKQPVDHFNTRDNRTWSMVNFFLSFEKYKNNAVLQILNGKNSKFLNNAVSNAINNAV